MDTSFGQAKRLVKFWDFDPVSNVTGGLRLLNLLRRRGRFLICTISLEPMDGISLHLHGHIIETSLRAV